VAAIYSRGEAVSRPASSTRSSCLLVNGGSGSSACGIRGGAVGQDSTSRDAVERELGRRERWREVAGGLQQR
jgi:hypothetical protein